METRRLADRSSRRRIAALAKELEGRVSWRARLWIITTWAAVAGLIFLALRGVPLKAILDALQQLNGWQILALVLANLAILGLMVLRWHLLLSSLGWRVPSGRLLAYRLAGFGVSYFTPGPQFGGEPVQVHLLHSRCHVPVSAAVSSVYLDRLIELLANFTFLVLGSSVIFSLGTVRGEWFGEWIWLAALFLLCLPAGHLLALLRGKRPAQWLAKRLWLWLKWPMLRKINEIAAQAESEIVRLSREKPGVLAQVTGLSLVIWVMMIGEFWLGLRFLNAPASFVEAISAMTAARLAILMPLPGGFGALEMGQTLAAGFLGWGPALGIAMSLLIRARDLILASAGLWVGGVAYRYVLFGLSKAKERSDGDANKRHTSETGTPGVDADSSGTRVGWDYPDNLDNSIDPFYAEYGDGR